MPPPQSEADIMKYIRRKLGGGIVDVELTEEHLKDASGDALSWWHTYVGQLRNHQMSISPGGGAFDVPDDVESIVEVVFQDNNSDFLDLFDWADVELSPIGYGSYYGSPSGSYSYLVQSRQYVEQGRRIIGADRDWEWDRQDRKLRLYPTNGTVGIGTQIRFKYLTNELDLGKLHTWEYDLVRERAFAEAMESLGYARTKYSEWPSATGSVTLNGDTLLANADNIKQSLDEKIKTLRPPVGFFTG